MTLSKAARASLFGLNLSSTMLISPFMFEFVKLSMLETSMLCSASCMTLSKVARAISFSGEENRGSPISVSSSWGGGAGALDFCLFCLLRSPNLEVITGDDVTGSFLLSKSSVSSRMGCGIFREELSLSENIGVRCCGVSKVA